MSVTPPRGERGGGGDKCRSIILTHSQQSVKLSKLYMSKKFPQSENLARHSFRWCETRRTERRSGPRAPGGGGGGTYLI